MTKKDIAILVAPLGAFLFLGVALLFMSGLLQQRIKLGDGHEKIDVLVENVRSGKWQPNTDGWLNGVRRQQDIMTGNLEVDVGIRELMLWTAFMAFLGIVLQISAVMHIRKRLKT